MKLEVGMYVRTYKGIIDKLDDKNIKMYQVSMFGLGDKPTKASYNIIDVIKVGDYVNEQLVYQIGYNFQDDYVIKVLEYDDYISWIYPNEIKSIVTKEQFESMSYKVDK